MWKHVENEEMEKYGMVIINEKKRELKVHSDSIRWMAEIPVFSNMAIGLFAQFFLWENLQETMVFTIKFSLKPVHW